MWSERPLVVSRRFVTFYISTLEILLLAYLLAYHVRLRHKMTGNKCNCYRQGSLLPVSDTNWQRLFTFWQNTEHCNWSMHDRACKNYQYAWNHNMITTLVSLRKISYISLFKLTNWSVMEYTITQTRNDRLSLFFYIYTYLLVQIPYNSSTKAMLRFRSRKRKRFLESLSENISLQNIIYRHWQIQNNVKHYQ